MMAILMQVLRKGMGIGKGLGDRKHTLLGERGYLAGPALHSYDQSRRLNREGHGVKRKSGKVSRTKEEDGRRYVCICEKLLETDEFFTKASRKE